MVALKNPKSIRQNALLAGQYLSYKLKEKENTKN